MSARSWSSSARAANPAATSRGGIQLALRRILTSPNFIFRIERDPLGIDPGEPYRINDLELASRLSFFLWNSVPDDDLIDLGARGRLGDRQVLERQVRRMLADPRADEFVENFAGQWLYLRRLASVEPDIFVFRTSTTICARRS